MGTFGDSPGVHCHGPAPATPSHSRGRPQREDVTPASSGSCPGEAQLTCCRMWRPSAPLPVERHAGGAGTCGPGRPVGGGGLRLSAGKNHTVPSASIGDMVPGASLPTLALSVPLSQMQ